MKLKEKVKKAISSVKSKKNKLKAAVQPAMKAHQASKRAEHALRKKKNKVIPIAIPIPGTPRK